MGRLTERYENGIAVPVQELDMPLLEEVIEKLAHYEDLEEAGRLIELPCAVGEPIYEIVNLGIKKHILGYKWKILRYLEYGIFGESAFLTKEEAEAKLKELSK